MLARAIRTMTAPHWLGLFAVVLMGWAALYFMAIPAELRSLSRIYGAGFWADLCRVTPDGAGFVRLWAMWALMAAAMMLPSALPALATYDDLPGGRFGRLVAGYLAVWFGFSAIAAAGQIGLYSLGAVDQTGASLSRWFSATLLIGAGGYQFSALKNACLTRCRAPLPFFMAHWSEGPVRMGVRLGLDCLGCCWALMLLAFVGGVMNLAFMGLATVLMTLEKLPELGRYLSAPLGVVLIGVGVWTSILGG